MKPGPRLARAVQTQQLLRRQDEPIERATLCCFTHLWNAWSVLGMMTRNDPARRGACMLKRLMHRQSRKDKHVTRVLILLVHMHSQICSGYFHERTPYQICQPGLMRPANGEVAAFLKRPSSWDLSKHMEIKSDLMPPALIDACVGGMTRPINPAMQIKMVAEIKAEQLCRMRCWCV